MKKLWQRSKSKVRGGQRERESAGGAGQGVGNASSAHREDSAIPPVPQRSDKRIATPEAIPRPGSSSRMQPMLIGISRPSATISRPGTAESIQNAIDRAADTVTHSSSLGGHKGHTRTRSPRYVDIFAIQNPKSSHLSYNEDVASRNIDVQKTAVEDVPYCYIPTSKYQEEVAARNAHGHEMSTIDTNYENLAPRTSAPRPQNATEPTYQIPPNKLANAEDIRRLHQAQLATLRQIRPYVSTKTAPQPLRASLDEIRHQKVHSRKASIEKAVHPVQLLRENAEPATISPTVRTSSDLPPTSPARRWPQDEIPRPRPPVSADSDVSQPSLSGYQLSQSEILQREMDAYAEARSAERNAEPSQGARAGRTRSTSSSSVRNAISLQHRTIMDLTGEDQDVFSSAGHDSEFGKISAAGSADDNSGEPENAEVDSPGGKDGLREAAETPSAQIQAAKENTATKLNLTARPATPEFRPPSSFSAINTIVSMPPRLNPNEAASPSPPPESAIRAYPAKPLARDEAPGLFTVAETEPEAEAFKTPAEEPATLFENPLPADPADKIHAAQVGSSDQTLINARPPSSPNSRADLEASVKADSTPKVIQMSPESLHSRDFVEPSRAFGVLTRDFAVTPTKAIHTVRSDREPNISAKVKQPRALVVNGDVPVPAASSAPKQSSEAASSNFDEEKFKQKQDAARAALIKLQQSLNEEFIPPPRTTQPPRNNTSRARTHSNSSTEGRAASSASAFALVNQNRAARPQRNGDVQPRTPSNRHLYSIRGEDRLSNSARPESSASTATVKPIQRQRSPFKETQDKDRQVDSALDEMRRMAREIANPRPVPKPLAAAQKQDKSNRNSNSTTSTTSTRSSQVLPSPGEVSLSSFPAPSQVQHSRPTSLILPIQNPADATPPITTRNSMVHPPRHEAPIAEEDSAPFPDVPRSPPVFTTPPPKTHISRLQREVQLRSPPPKSVPARQPNSPTPTEQRRTLSRRGSTHSQGSSSSQFSIPYHLIPERGSSMRDSLVREVDDEM